MSCPSQVDFAVSLVLLVGLMAIYRITPTRNVVFLPFFVAFATMTALSVGLWLSALNDGVRWAVLGRESAITTCVSVVVAAIFLGGLACFRRMEASFADEV